jgi:hypothetical protein
MLSTFNRGESPAWGKAGLSIGEAEGGGPQRFISRSRDDGEGSTILGAGSGPRSCLDCQMRRRSVNAALFPHKLIVPVDLACKSGPAERDIS